MAYIACCCSAASATAAGHSATAAVARGGEVEALRRGAARQREPQEVGGRREGDGDGEQRVVGGGVEHGGQRHPTPTRWQRSVQQLAPAGPPRN